MSEIKYEFLGIGTLIKNRSLKVPIHQRPYSWVDEHVLALLNDIKSTLMKKNIF